MRTTTSLFLCLALTLMSCQSTRMSGQRVVTVNGQQMLVPFDYKERSVARDRGAHLVKMDEHMIMADVDENESKGWLNTVWAAVTAYGFNRLAAFGTAREAEVTSRAAIDSGTTLGLGEQAVETTAILESTKQLEIIEAVAP